MATDLRSVHVRITVETDAVVDAKAKALDKDRAEILRDVLHQWALKEIEVGRLIEQRLRAEGISGSSAGGSGSGADSRGSRP